MFVDVLSRRMSVHHICAWCLQRPEMGIRSPEIGVIDGWELPFGYWESKLCHWELKP